MNGHDLLAHLAKENNDEVAKLTSDLALGKAKDHAAYQYACGIIRGLMLANGKLADVEAHLNGDDE